MLVVLGGLLGSGTRTLANELAMKYGLYRYEIDSKKLRKPVLGPHGNFTILQPNTDEERLRIYKNIFKDFPLLSKMYPDVIVDDVFHRKSPREYFLSEARKYYESVVFVWIDSDDESVKIRLTRMEKAGKVPSFAEAMHRREWAQSTLQLPVPPPLRFSYWVSGDERIAAEQTAALWKLIQQHVQS